MLMFTLEACFWKMFEKWFVWKSISRKSVPKIATFITVYLLAVCNQAQLTVFAWFSQKYVAKNLPFAKQLTDMPILTQLCVDLKCLIFFCNCLFFTEWYVCIMYGI